MFQTGGAPLFRLPGFAARPRSRQLWRRPAEPASPCQLPQASALSYSVHQVVHALGKHLVDDTYLQGYVYMYIEAMKRRQGSIEVNRSIMENHEMSFLVFGGGERN